MVRLRVDDEVSWDGEPVRGERPAALLRALVEAGPRGLSESALVEEVWADDAPANPAKALQVVVSRVRAATAAEAVVRTERGYRLGLAQSEVDEWRLVPEALHLAGIREYAAALPLLERAAAPSGVVDDDVMAALLRSLAAVRGVPVALARYESYRVQLADLLGVDPSPALRALHADLLARDRPVRAGLRYDADRLIGRASALADLRALIATHRLVSIVGPGGLGKTRLAHLAGRDADMPVIHFVELVSVISGEAVPVEVADALGARESVAQRRAAPTVGRADSVSRIVDLVGTVPTLLILDNCEQVVSAVADLVSTLLARTPALTVLTTTRIPLGLAAEQVYLLPELGLDDAAALFAERARAARPGVVLEEERVRALVARLDGLPLAVELAAARVRAMGVEEIIRRLDDRFALLRGGSRDAPERHQTLLAVIDWSWNLLDPAEKDALRWLAVFGDGFSLDSASSVLGSDAAEAVTRLAEQSLIVVRENEGVRYRLLETVREFGRRQLELADDVEEAAARLSRWAVEVARGARRRLFTPDQVATMSLIREEEGNLVEVLRQASAAGDVGVVAPVLAVLACFWSVEGAHLKIFNLGVPAEPLLSAGPVPPPCEDDARVALALTLLTSQMLAGGCDSAGVDALRTLGPGTEPRTRAIVTVVLAMQDAAAVDHVGVLDELIETGDRHVAQWAAMWASQFHENAGDLDRAVETGERARSLASDDDGPWARALVEAHLAGLALQSGRHDEAWVHATAAMPAMAALGAVEDWAQARAVLALVSIARGDLDLAETVLDELAADERVQSVFGGAISQLCGRAELLLARGEIDAGLSAYRDAVARLSDRAFAGLDVSSGFEPWVLFPCAAMVAAHCRFGRRLEAAHDRDTLREKALNLLESGDRLLDHPVMGTVLLALGAWELTGGGAVLGSALVEYAEAFSLNRVLPSLDPGWAGPLAVAERPASYSPPDARDPGRLVDGARALVVMLG